MNDNFAKALTEVNIIIEHSEEKVRKLIPEKVKENIKQNMDINYQPDFDYTKTLMEQKMLKDTEKMIYILYKKCMSKEVMRLEEEEKNKDKEKYDIYKMFEERKDKQIQEKNVTSEELPMIKEKESNIIKTAYNNIKEIVSKIFNSIRNIFKRH